MAGLGLTPLLGCSHNGEGAAGSPMSSGATTSAGGASSCSRIPEETAGPYPGDGSNGENALELSGIVRSDIRSSIGDLTGTAQGVPLTVTLKLVKSSGDCAALSGLAVYIWHCDRDGQYSLYTITDQNYLRGVQETNSDGAVTFTSIFPACYPGRWPHIHFEVYPSLASATGSSAKLGTSQLALPEDACSAVYASAGYEASVATLAQISLATDGVFGDGSTLQVASVSGSVTSGYVATLTVAIAS
jgi:protocatechuate 3,4-dioxygenase beta subunit